MNSKRFCFKTHWQAIFFHRNIYYWSCMLYFFLMGNNSQPAKKKKKKKHKVFVWVFACGWYKHQEKQPLNDTKGEGTNSYSDSGFSLKRFSSAHCQVTDSSSAASKSNPEVLKQRQRPSVVISHSIHSHATVSLACVSQCKSARVHVRVSMWMKKVNEGLRRQQSAWEPRGHGAGIDFINRLSQHSGSGCSTAPLETQNVGHGQTGRMNKAHLRHFILTAKWLHRLNTSLTYKPYVSLKMNEWSWCGISQLQNKKQQSIHAKCAAINLSTLGMSPNCHQWRVICSHLFGLMIFQAHFPQMHLCHGNVGFRSDSSVL